MLVLSRGRDESIMCSGPCEVMIVDIRCDKVRLGFDAPKETAIYRKEIWEQIQRDGLRTVDTAKPRLRRPVRLTDIAASQKAERKQRMKAQSERQRAERLRDQVLKTWNPPLTGMGGPVDVAQTSVMQTLAFVFGDGFFPKLTAEQTAAIRGGMEAIRSEIGE